MRAFFVFALFVQLCVGSFSFAEEEVKQPATEEVKPQSVTPLSEPRSTLLANYSFMNGHNLSATSDILKPGYCALGLDVAACGVTRRFTLGTSTWLLYDYNMYSLAGRFVLSQDAKRNRWAMQVNYFKTFPVSRAGRYKMESTWLKVIRTLNFARHYRMHINFDVAYYQNEQMPFSLRRPYVKNTPWQFNLSALNEVDFVDGWFALFEAGFLDFARTPLHVHGGASIGKVWRNFSFHFGASITSALAALDQPLARDDYQQRLRLSSEGYDQYHDPEKVKYDFAIHPEFSFQVLF